jgi:hypothetical protein
MKRAAHILLVLFAACASESHPQLHQPASLEIVNQSQYVLTAVLRSLTPDYRAPDSEALGSLALGAQLVLHGSGRWFVTVEHEKYSGGPQVALTTGEALILSDDEGYLLGVLDQSFRLESAPLVPPTTTSTGS